MITEKLCLTRDRLVSHQQLACYQSFCAVLNGKDILIYYSMDAKKLQLQLTGHHGDISVMTFGKGNRPVLCSASAEYIIIWDIKSCQKRAGEGKIAVGTIIATLLGEVVHLSFSASDGRVAACTADTTYILNSKKQETISSLTGHLGLLTSAEFCSWNSDILVTTSEDRTFKVWDLLTESVCYQSFVLSGSPLISVIFLSETQQFYIGSLDGQVWCFSLTNKDKCHQVNKTDLQKIEKRHRMLQESLGQQTGESTQCTPGEVETAKPVLKMELCFSPATDDKQKSSWICIGSTDCLYMLDVATAELLTVLYFKDYPELSITMAGYYSTYVSQDNNFILLFVSALFTPCLSLLEINICDLQKTWVKSEGLSVFPSSPPLPESSLNAQLKKKNVNLPKKKGGIKDHSLVFNTKVKSSGYTSAPRRVMFTPKTNVKKSPSPKTTSTRSFKVQDYPEVCTAPSVSKKEFATSNKPVYSLEYSGDGKQVLCGLGDCSVLLCQPSLTGNPTVYTGHDKAVSCVSWSLSRQWWLSASEDQTLRIWAHKSPEPAIIMQGNCTFSKPIRRAQFYYLDKFVLAASGPLLHMFLYNIDTNRDDIKRYQQHSAVKLTKSLSISATEITDLSSINDFVSYIVLVCGSDRSIQVFDMNRGAVAAKFPDAHSRAVHCITQNKGSLFSAQAPDSYNLFLTSAVTDGIKIWDLRTLGCVRRYENHVNRYHSCSSTLSPCGRYIATGSEDNCAYVYDVRSSSYLHKLFKESSPVLSVAFNPSTPELLTGTLDGRLRLFQPSTGQCLSPNTTSTVA